MATVKGSCVRCSKTGKLGVVSIVPNTSGFRHVSWLISWNAGTNELHHYQEFVAIHDLEDLGFSPEHHGLAALRKYVLK